MSEKSNQVAKTTNTNGAVEVSKSISDFLSMEKVNAKIEQILGESKREFIASVISLYNGSKDIQECTMPSIVNACLMAAAFKLPVSNALGFVYVYGFNNRQPNGSYKKEATFMLGYKGVKQLCMRSGQFVRMNEVPVYAGQLKKIDPLKGDFEFDFTVEPKGDPVGYAAYFRLENGFEKMFYMNTNQVIQHAKKYSPTYGKINKKTSQPIKSTWDSNFDEMALKTVSKRNLSKGEAPMSIEMQNAFLADNAVIKEVHADGSADFEHLQTEDVAHEVVETTSNEASEENSNAVEGDLSKM